MSFREGLYRGTPLQRLALALLLAGASARGAAAQTVVVRSAPAGASVEVTLNSGAPVTAKADASGDATLAVPGRTPESQVTLHVDACDAIVRVHVVERGLQAPVQDAGCTRADLGSVFIMRPVTTFVVDVAGAGTTVHVAQGPAPVEWLHRGPGPARTSSWGTPKLGLTASAGVGLSSFSDFTTRACGDAAGCAKSDGGGSIGFGVDYWIKPYVAAHVGYLRPHDVTALGNGTGFRFDSRLQSRFFLVGGKVGGAVGPARLYGMGGASRHEATLTTSQTVDDPASTQTYGQQTKGWNWFVGGGVEGWVTSWIAVYGEVTRLKVKGDPVGGGEGGLDDAAMIGIGGIRVRLWR